MTYHRLISQDYFDEMTHPSLRWVQDVAKSSGKHCGAIRMSDDADDRMPVTQMKVLWPGAVVPRHANDCYVVEVVVIGSISLDGGEVLTVGDVMVAKPGEYHGPRVAGPDGALVAAFYTDINAAVTFSEEMLSLDARITAGQSRG
jgi:anti-sigma factor ChrR (cupin superfamily)